MKFQRPIQGAVLYCTVPRRPCNPQFIPGLLWAPAGSRPRDRTASLSALSPNLPRRGSSAPPGSLFALTPSLCLTWPGPMGGEGPAQCNVVRSCPLINLGSFIRLDFLTSPREPPDRFLILLVRGGLISRPVDSSFHLFSPTSYIGRRLPTFCCVPPTNGYWHV